MQRNAAEENNEEWDPFEVFNESCEKRFLLNPIAENGESYVSKSGEHNDDREVDLEAVNVVMVQRTVEPAY